MTSKSLHCAVLRCPYTVSAVVRATVTQDRTVRRLLPMGGRWCAAITGALYSHDVAKGVPSHKLPSKVSREQNCAAAQDAHVCDFGEMLQSPWTFHGEWSDVEPVNKLTELSDKCRFRWSPH